MESSLRTIPKIDAHHHLWDVDSNRYPWLVSPNPVQRIYGDSQDLRVNYRIKDYLADVRNQSVIKSVHVQTGWQPEDPVGETRHLQAIADGEGGGFPHAIVAAADLTSSNLNRVLEGHCSYANMRGIRVSLNWHDNPTYRWADRSDYMTDPAFQRGFSLLSSFGLSFDCQVYPHQMADAARLADLSPETPFVILHAGMPADRDAAGLGLWRRGLRSIAERPQAAIKFCGLSMIIHAWTAETMRRYAAEIIDIFGPDRVMFASNFPVDRLKGSFDAYFDAYGFAVSAYSTDEQRLMFYDNAARIYRLV